MRRRIRPVDPDMIALGRSTGSRTGARERPARTPHGIAVRSADVPVTGMSDTRRR